MEHDLSESAKLTLTALIAGLNALYNESTSPSDHAYKAAHGYLVEARELMIDGTHEAAKPYVNAASDTVRALTGVDADVPAFILPTIQDVYDTLGSA